MKLINTVFGGFLLVQGLSLTSLTHAQTDVEIFKRCTTDSLNAKQARGRNDWSKACGYISQRDWQYYMYDDFGKLRSRPKYQSYFNPNNFNDWLRAPTSFVEPCDRGHYTKIIYCVSSCYTPDQILLFPQGEMTIYDAFSKRVTEIVTLSEEASLSQLSYQNKKLAAYSESLIAQTHNILHIQMQSGGALKVTPNHPLMLSTGHMVNASQITTNDHLIAQDGHFDPVIAIDTLRYHGKVYNVQPSMQDNSLKGQIVIAQGYLSGSMFYQNEGKDMTGRLILRSNIPKALL